MTKKQMLHVAAFLLCAVVAVSAASRLLMQKSSQDYYGWVLEEDSSADVMFFGASHVVAGVQAGELWDQYGITAYNCGVAGQAMNGTYWQMRLVFEQKLPQVAVVDVHTLSWVMENTGMESVHNTLDCLPLSPTKVQAAFDLADPGDRLELLFPFAQFHARWEDLSMRDFVEPERLFGEEASGAVAKYYATDPLLPQTEQSEETPARQTLRRIAELCQQQGVQLVLVQLPGPNTDFQQRHINGAALVAQEYGVPYLDFQRLDVINNETDFRDLGWSDTNEFAYHINASGAKKVTAYLGEFLRQTYGLADHRGQADCALWQEKGEKYRDRKLQLLTETDDLYRYLALLADPDVSAAIVLPAGSELCQDPQALALLQNLGLSPDAAQLQAGKSYLGVSDTVNKTVEELTTDGDGSRKTYMGTIRFTGDLQQGRYNNPGLEFALQDYSLRIYNDIDPQPGAVDIQILLFDNRTALPVQCVTFDHAGRSQQYERSGDAVLPAAD